MSHDDVRMIGKNRLQQLQAVILSKIYRREELRLLSISQEADVVQELEEGIRENVSGHAMNTHSVCIQGSAVY